MTEKPINTAITAIILLVLMIALFTYEVTIKEKEIVRLKANIKLLNKEIEQLKEKKLPVGLVSIGKNTLQVVTSRPDRFLHIKELIPGRNYYDFAMHEGQRVEVVVWNY